MSWQTLYDTVRNALGFGPAEHVIIVLEPPVDFKPKPINAFDFHGGRAAPKSVERQAESMRAVTMRVQPVKPTTKPPKLKRGAKEAVIMSQSFFISEGDGEKREISSDDLVRALVAERDRLRGWWELVQRSRDPHAAYCASHALAGDPVPITSTKTEEVWR